MVYNRVTAHDRANTVILGDPTAALPLPPRWFVRASRTGEDSCVMARKVLGPT
jgi:hypothetical protein